ncbi:hypothetical protein SCA6_007108 [Theobroma cacao]
MIPNAFLTTHMVGDGSSIRFWSNPWVGEVTLSELFPKMFALTRNEERFINEQGIWNGNIAEQIKACLNIGSDPVTFIQGALPQNLEKTNKDFFSKYINILKQTSDILCDRIKEIPCITCPQKPKGSVFIMVKLDLSLLEGIDDDMDFCAKLAMEESVSILPGEKCSPLLCT